MAKQADGYHPPGVPAAPAEDGQDLPREPRTRGQAYDDELKAKLGRLSVMGFDFVIAVLVLGGAGYAIDRWAMGGGVAFTIAGVCLGLVVGTYRFIKDAMAALKPPAKK
jgi:F0F1-type ATP synthase assembly protein I